MTHIKLCTLSGLLIITLLAIENYVLADDWLCTEESSVRIGGAYGSIHSCGVGEAPNESQARANAFDSAKAEFDRVCSNSVDCHRNSVVVEPARTTCSKNQDGYKCYRMVIFHLEQVHNEQVAAQNTQQTNDADLQVDPFSWFREQNKRDATEYQKKIEEDLNRDRHRDD
jgi:hypothetical protein